MNFSVYLVSNKNMASKMRFQFRRQYHSDTQKNKRKKKNCIHTYIYIYMVAVCNSDKYEENSALRKQDKNKELLYKVKVNMIYIFRSSREN